MDKKKNFLITLPASTYDVENALPKTDCKDCGYNNCFSLASKIKRDISFVNKCPNMATEMYWLNPRADCRDCGYATCLDFANAVNKQRASVFDCPYAFGKDKKISTDPPKVAVNASIVRNNTRLITLPASTYDIEHTLPKTDCKTCGYASCFSFASQIRRNGTGTDKCPYMQAELYWLSPRADCRDCGYASCLDFAKEVNKDRASVFDCPYAYGKNKMASVEPPKTQRPTNVVRNKNRLITLPASTFDIENTLPKTDCKACGYDSCFSLASKINNDASAVDKCLYMQAELYWLSPRADCRDCGYASCLDFAKEVNKDRASVFECPYAFGKDKKVSLDPPKPGGMPNAIRNKDRLITLPASTFDIENVLPKTDCKACGYSGCFSLASKINNDASEVDKCLYMQAELYWLNPRADCRDCGYASCLDFAKEVNKDRVSVFDCPYSYGKNKMASVEPPKTQRTVEVVRNKNKLITLPASTFDIENTLPKTDCKACGYTGCFSLASKINDDASAVDKCPYMQYKLYWLEPRADCKDCGYQNCVMFEKAVNDGRASVADCPYAYCEDKPGENKVQIKMNTKEVKPSKEIKGIEDVIKLFTKNLDIKVNVKEVGYLPPDEKPKKEELKRPILNTKYCETLTSQEKEKFFKKQLEKANELIKDKKISKDLELIIQNNTDIYEMAHKHPSLEKQINKFSSTYLPMTLELLNEYLMLESKVLYEEATDKQQQKIAEAIAKAKAAFIKLNDDLFRQISYDIDAQIKAFDDILAIDGLLSDDDFKIDQDDDKKEDR